MDNPLDVFVAAIDNENLAVCQRQLGQYSCSKAEKSRFTVEKEWKAF
jgi:hypothetical protein